MLWLSFRVLWFYRSHLQQKDSAHCVKYWNFPDEKVFGPFPNLSEITVFSAVETIKFRHKMVQICVNLLSKNIMKAPLIKVLRLTIKSFSTAFSLKGFRWYFLERSSTNDFFFFSLAACSKKDHEPLQCSECWKFLKTTINILTLIRFYLWIWKNMVGENIAFLTDKIHLLP